MTQAFIDNRIEGFREDINYQIVRNFGTRLTINRIRPLNNEKYEVYFNYNKVFNVVNKKTKTVFIRNIFFKDIYSVEISARKKLQIPISEINKAIDDEFIDLRDNLFQKVISNKKIVIKILKKIHMTSAFLNKFYTLFNELFHSDVIPNHQLNEFIMSDEKYKKYIELIIDAGLADYSDKGLKASNTFKMLLENNKPDPTTAIEIAVFEVIKKNYDYIVYEMGLRHIKAYVNIIACLYYLTKHYKIDEIGIAINQLFHIYENFFGRTTYPKFKERVNSLVMAGVFQRENDLISLAIY